MCTNFLKTEKNSYTEFIRKKQLIQRITNSLEIKEMRHIQLLHAQNCDEEWNKIVLSYNDHTEAHKLLFKCYGNFFEYSSNIKFINILINKKKNNFNITTLSIS